MKRKLKSYQNATEYTNYADQPHAKPPTFPYVKFRWEISHNPVGPIHPRTNNIMEFPARKSAIIFT